MGIFEILAIGVLVFVIIGMSIWWTRRSRVRSVAPVTTVTTQTVYPVAVDPTIDPVVEQPVSDPVHSSRVER